MLRQNTEVFLNTAHEIRGAGEANPPQKLAKSPKNDVEFRLYIY